MTTDITTELTAVNQMLSSIGESAVSSLDSGLPDAEKALRILRKVKREVQERGWSWNTDEKIRWSPDDNSQILIPATALQVDSDYTDQRRDVVVRGSSGKRLLYDRDKNTFVHTKPIYVKVVWEFDFDVCSEAFKTYVTYRAAQRFQVDAVGSVVLDRFAQTEMAMAWAALQDAEMEAGDYNALSQNPRLRYQTRRNHRRYR